MKKKIILIGTGGHLISTINLIESLNIYKIVGLVSNSKLKKKILGYSIIGEDKDLPKIFKNVANNCCIAIGQIKDSQPRNKIFKKLKKIGFNLPSLISRSVYIDKSIKIGEGSIIFHNSILNSNVSIGNNCIINSGAIIEHDTTISENCHISTGVIINGSVFIGKNTFIGSGTIIKQNLKIGNNCVIGMGEKIKRNVKNNCLIK